MTAITDKKLVTAAEAAYLLSMSVERVRGLAANGVLDRVYIGKGTTHYRIVAASLDAYIEGGNRDPLRDTT